MATIGLSFYRFRVCLHNSQKAETENLPLNDINGVDIGYLLYDEFKKLSESYTDNRCKESLTRFDYAELSKHMIKQDYVFSSIKAIIKTGQYGVENEIVDSRKIKSPVRIQSKDEATVKPFGAALYYSENIKTGLMIVQTYGHSGVYSFLKDFLSNIIKRVDNNMYVEVKSVAPHEYIADLFENSKLSQICVETYKNVKSKDLDKLNAQDFPFDYSVKESRYKVPIIKDKKYFFNRVVDAFSTRKKLNDTMFATLTGGEEEISNIKFILNHNGKEKSINYKTYYNMRITEDITKEVIIDEEKAQPTRESLLKLMDSKAKTYLDILNIIEDVNEQIDVKCEKIFYTLKSSSERLEVKEKINE